MSRDNYIVVNLTMFDVVMLIAHNTVLYVGATYISSTLT